MVKIYTIKGFELSFDERDVIIKSSVGKVRIPFDRIQRVNLVPVRRTFRYYFPPACIIKTDNAKYKITARKSVFHAVSSMFESANDDLQQMSSFAHQFHRFLTEKGLNETIKFQFEGPLMKGALFIYPVFLALPVIAGFDGSIIAIVICLGVYLILIWLTKKREYDPLHIAEDIKQAVFYLK